MRAAEAVRPPGGDRIVAAGTCAEVTGVAAARMAGLGAALPERRVTSEELQGVIARAGGFRLPPGLLARATGVRSRHWRLPGQQASELAAAAGRCALADAGLAAGDIDTVIFAAASQDMAEPATANLVQERLGCTDARCFDVKNACCSFLNGLEVAQMLVETGRAERVLVAAGEVVSPVVDCAVTSAADLAGKLAALTLGDAGGAMVVVAAHPGDVGVLHRGAFVSDGRHWRASAILGGGSRGWGRRPTLECDGTALLQLAARHLPTVVDRALSAAGWDRDDVDLVVPHQVSQPMIDALGALLGFAPEAVVSTVADTGNTAAASIPLALAGARRDGLVPPGTRVLLLAGAGGFAAGCVPLEL